jgi:predicted ATP-grasp superfamily ATP-dependent carboligase
MRSQGLAERRGSVLVTDAGRGSAVAVIRSLGRRGFRVVAADSDPRSAGLRSRYAHEAFIYPEPKSGPQRFVEALAGAVRERRVDLVIPVTDEAIQPLAAERHRFETVCKLALPEPSVLDAVTDKAKTLELAARLDVPAPRTQVVHNVDEALPAAAALGWPVVLKPAVSRRYDRERGVVEAYSVAYANCAEELGRRMQALRGAPAVLLQEYSPGVGQGVEMLADRGRPLAVFQHRRLAEIPVSGGASAWRESVRLDPVLYEYSRRLVAALSWTGLVMVEFKVGQAPFFMEVNGRIWGSLPLAVLSGMDFPSRLADLYLGSPPADGLPPVTDYKVGVRAQNLELTVLWILQVLLGRQKYSFLPWPKRREALAALLGLLSPRQKLDILCWDDPRPGLAEIRTLLRKLLRKALGTLRSDKSDDLGA